MNDWGLVPDKFHGQRAPFGHYGPTEARFLGLKLTFNLNLRLNCAGNSGIKLPFSQFPQVVND